MPTAPAWQMGTTWQQRQAAGPDWRTELRPVRSAIMDRQRAPTPSFGPPQQFTNPNFNPGPTPWEPTDGPTSLEDLASNWGSSPQYGGPPGLQGGGPPGLNGFGPPGQGGGTPGGFGMGGGPPAWANNRFQEAFGETPGQPGGPKWSQYAGIIGGGALGGFGGYSPRPSFARPAAGGRPRRRRRH